MSSKVVDKWAIHALRRLDSSFTSQILVEDDVIQELEFNRFADFHFLKDSLLKLATAGVHFEAQLGTQISVEVEPKSQKEASVG